jgi:hypothetical protein
MTQDEIDIMWQQAMQESIKDGEMFTRYHFAKLVAERALAQEKALQALHDENERLGLYRDAYAEQEPVAWMWDVNNGGGYTSKGIGFMQTNIPFAKHTPLYTHPPQRTETLIGCVNHDCAKCKERTEQEPDYWLGYGLQAHTEKPFENATALYKDPPQRTWVGLTEQDLDYLCNLAYTGDEEFALAVQAKLMEKNA